MSKHILERYARRDDGRLILDVAAAGVADLYNDFDRASPYRRKDLDGELVDYLMDCAREIGPRPFAVRITLSAPPDNAQAARVRTSMHSYFEYLNEAEKRTMRRMMRTSLILLSLGAAILGAAIWVNRVLGDDPAVWARVCAEGLTVAAWVSLWEALATFLVQWPGHRREVRLHNRLAAAPVEFAPAPSPGNVPSTDQVSP